MGTSTVIQHARGVKRSAETQAEPNPQQELRIETVSHALQIALFEAHLAGLDDVVDRIGPLHLEVVRRLHQLREAA
jgi:hypothetical protein